MPSTGGTGASAHFAVQRSRAAHVCCGSNASNGRRRGSLEDFPACGIATLCELLHTEVLRLAGIVFSAQSPSVAVVQPQDEQVRQTTNYEGRMKILYVEDNEDNIYMLKNRLSRVGFTVIVATDGTHGVTMATSEQPDLILMDLTLPDIAGEEATRRLKDDPATKSIPVIALTANAMASDRERAIAAGCDEFETKPVDMPRLLGKIAAFNGRS